MEIKSKPKFKPGPELKLMDQVRQALRYHRYACCDWIIRFIVLNGSKIHYQKQCLLWRGLINLAWCLNGSKHFYNSNFSDVKENIPFGKLFYDVEVKRYRVLEGLTYHFCRYIEKSINPHRSMPIFIEFDLNRRLNTYLGAVQLCAEQFPGGWGSFPK